jgi:nucleotide-binding universal stress UspA family protein
MSFRDPLVVLRPYPASTSQRSVARAVRMAAAVSDRVSAIACGVIPMVPRGILGNSVLGLSAMVGEEKHKSAQDVQRLLAQFSEQVAKAGLGLGECISEMRPSPEVPGVLADHARLFDLTIMPLPEEGHVARLDAQWYVEDILFGSGHPTIIVPESAAADGPITLDRIIVAWDKSPTAARAIADAIPVLRLARNVHIVTVAGDKHIASERSGDELARHLALQGIKVVVEVFDADGRGAGDVLRYAARVHDADLVVMGAYGRSRMMEFILGGATKAMLTRPPTALFMSH